MAGDSFKPDNRYPKGESISNAKTRRSSLALRIVRTHGALEELQIGEQIGGFLGSEALEEAFGHQGKFLSFEAPHV